MATSIYILAGMDETTRSIIEKITVTYKVPVKVHGGHTSKVFYDCIRLTPNDLARLAAQAGGDHSKGSFDICVGLAYTGVFFAAALAGGKQVAILQVNDELFGPSISGKRVILVDDVILTGTRLNAAKLIVEKAGARVEAFACIIDRSEGRVASSTGIEVWSALQTGLE